MSSDFSLGTPSWKLTKQVIIVTHGAFAHFLTEDWDVEDPMIGTAYNNCRLNLKKSKSPADK